MLPKPELAYFAIADISGYTSFLTGVELDHAQDIIADFMDTVVKRLRPPFRLAKFEGDAVFVYAVAEKVDGSLLQDTIESAYFKFRRRLRDVKQASTCECKACVAMSDLDFKFVVHHGEMPEACEAHGARSSCECARKLPIAAEHPSRLSCG
jgi:Protein of unknown function (DUF2652)